MNRDYILSKTVAKHKCFNDNMASAHMCVRNMKEDTVPNYTYLGLTMARM
jgi:hypothetical protein